MWRTDILFVMLILYLGLSAWAYRDVRIKRAKTEPQPVAAPAHPEASYWQFVGSALTLVVGVLLLTSGMGLLLRGALGIADWTVLDLTGARPMVDILIGVAAVLVGGMLAYETRYSIIKHPRPPGRFTGRLV